MKVSAEQGNRIMERNCFPYRITPDAEQDFGFKKVLGIARVPRHERRQRATSLGLPGCESVSCIQHPPASGTGCQNVEPQVSLTMLTCEQPCSFAIPKDIQAHKPIRLPAPDGFSIKVSLSPAGKSNLIFCKGKINLR